MEHKLLYIILATSTVLIGLAITETKFPELDEKQLLARQKEILELLKSNLTRPNMTYKEFNMTRRTDDSSVKTWLFKDYLMKYNPNMVFERINKDKKKRGKNASVEEDFDALYEGIDNTDDLLRLDVEAMMKSGRRKWTPSGKPDHSARGKDPHSLRMRLFELIRHVIYQTRNRMVIMQVLRTKYRNSSLYKMGFLISRTDFACKDFHAFAYRTIHACPNRYLGNALRYEIISMLHAEERLNNKWFEIELLIDLINQNHRSAQEVIAKHFRGRKEKWAFIP